MTSAIVSNMVLPLVKFYCSLTHAHEANQYVYCENLACGDALSN
jgi:hypothetical protein